MYLKPVFLGVLEYIALSIRLAFYLISSLAEASIIFNIHAYCWVCCVVFAVFAVFAAFAVLCLPCLLCLACFLFFVVFVERVKTIIIIQVNFVTL